MARLWFEDFREGDTADYGRHAVTREEIVSFAAQFDPQPMHLDEAAGAASILGGLAASGWHSCAILMRLICQGWLNESAAMGAPGIDQVKWLRPVRPGDVLGARHTVLETRVSRSKPDRGFVRFRFQLLDQAGRVAMEQENSIMFATRGGGPSAGITA
jgi:acyl dehydratase